MQSNLDLSVLTANKNLAARNYWKNRIVEYKDQSCFRIDNLVADKKTFSQYKLFGSEELAISLKKLASNPKAQHVVLLSALGVLAYQHSLFTDIYIFTPVYSSDSSDASSIPVKLPDFSKATFKSVLNAVKEDMLLDFTHSDYPLEKILNIPENKLANLSVTGLMVEGLQYRSAFEELQPDLLFSFNVDDSLALNLTYNTDKYNEVYISGLTEAYFYLLSSLLNNLEIKINEVEVLSKSAKAKVIEEIHRFRSGLNSTEVLYPASYHQERLWFIDKFESGYLYKESPVYHNIPLIFSFTGNLDIQLLEKSIVAVVDNHTVLKTNFISVDDKLFQQIGSATCGLAIATSKSEAHSNDLLTSIIDAPFKVDELYLRATLLQKAENKSDLIITFHHLIADRYSIVLLAEEILNSYKALLQHKHVEIKKSTIQYSDFTLWQRRALAKIEPQLVALWKKQLGNSIKALELPTDTPRAAVHIFTASTQLFTISGALLEKIKLYQENPGTTNLEVILMAAFKILLYKYCRHEEIVIGTSVNNRDSEFAKSIIGPVSNLIVIKSFVNPEDNFGEYTFKLNRILEDCKEFHQMPFDKLVDQLSPEKDMSRTALFDVLFQFDNTNINIPDIPGLEINITDNNRGYGKYDLNLFLHENESTIGGTLVYNSDYFNHTTIEAFIKHYHNIIDQLVSRPDTSFSDIEIIDECEKNDLLKKLSFSNVSFPAERTLVDLFKEQVQKTPNQVALKFALESVTYKELDERSDRIAIGLRNKGVLRNSIVALLVDKSIEAVIGMLSIIKAGGSYLPIDIAYPSERKEYLITNSGSFLILTSKSLSVDLPLDKVTLFIEDLEQTGKSESIEYINQPSDLCYIIYTSGTTGNPKGVMVEHQNVVRLFFNDKFQFNFSPTDVWTMFHSHCFDFSVWEIFGALLFGGKLIIIPKIVARDTKLYHQLLIDEKVTVLNQTPSAFYNLMNEELANPKTELSLRYIIFGGEKLSPSKLKNWYSKYPVVKLINMYGITETTVHVTYKEIGTLDIYKNVSNIGRPIPTLSAYVFDPYKKLVPQGIIGELYVGGAGVARGYLNNESLTKQKFCNNPYHPVEKLYRTGDLVRLLPSGDLEYIGRIDHQVQLRGFRIELGEIESQLGQHAAITEVKAVMGGNEEDKYLIAYYVAQHAIKDSELRSFLLSKLPDHMVPSYFIHLTTMPLTSNGKIDTKLLPEPESQISSEYIAPSSITETALVQIWSEILNVNQNLIGINSDFFELGGHSLRAMNMVNKILKNFNVTVPLKEIFERRTITNISDFIDSVTTGTNSTILKAKDKPYYPLSAAQKAIYFFHEFDNTTLGYNMPRVLKLTGVMDKEKVAAVFTKLIARHENLRTSFEIINSEPVQKIWPGVDFQIVHLKADTEVEVRRIIKDQIKHFDLRTAPLLRVALVEVDPNKHYLVVDSHHIVMDGTSWSILTREFKELYLNEELQPLNWQYRDFIEWQNTEVRYQERLKQKEFWVDMFSDGIPKLELPTDFPRPDIKSNVAGDVSFNLNPEEVSALKSIAENEGVTIFMVLLSAYTILLGKLTEQNEVIIGTPIAGRDHPDLQNILGMFVNVLPLKNSVQEDISFAKFLNEVKTSTIKCFENQSYEYQSLIEDLKIQRESNRSALFDAMFIYQNFDESVLEIPELSITPYYASQTISEFDISLTVHEGDQQIQLAFGYQKALFKEETVRRFVSYLRRIISVVITDINSPISKISLLSNEELRLVLSEFNNTTIPFSDNTNLIKLFEDQVLKTPDALCIVSEGQKLTYQEVNNLANQIARHLRHHHGVDNGDLVGLLLERNKWLYVAILGVLKTGAAYLPLDKTYPEARISYILKDSNVKITLSDFDVVFPETNVIQLQNIESLLSFEKVSNLPNFSGPEDIAYIIYTSGSTGQPKAVLQTHQTIINLVEYQVRETEPAGTFSKNVSQFASHCFDVSVQEIFYALLNGNTLFIVPEDIKFSPADMVQFTKEKAINILYLPTSYLEYFALEANSLNQGDLKDLERIIVAGEALKSTAMVLYFFKKFPHIILENQYGPSETHVVSSYTLPSDPAEWESLPSIGKPIANTRIYILNSSLSPVPLNSIGEIYVSGAGVFPGYLNAPDLTSQRLISNPFSGGLMYRTGDLGRWNADGTIRFVGRRDDQVKIRGYRIELGEINQVMLQFPGISNAAVIIKDRGGEKYVAAYYSCIDEIDESVLKLFVTGRLPGYMVPAYYLKVPKIPLTGNGKVNKDALPEPGSKVFQDFVAPENILELKLASIWADVLKLEKDAIDVNSSFFELGGHSLNAITLTNKIFKELNVKISLRELFVKPTIRCLAEYVELHSWVNRESDETPSAKKEIII